MSDDQEPIDENRPFKRLEAEHKAEQLAEQAKHKLTRARIKLLPSGDPKDVFFSHLCMRLNPVCRPGIGTMAVDGRNLYYEPEFTVKLTDAQLRGVLVHEVLHCAFQHFARRNNRNPFGWNLATDLAINEVLRDNGYELPEGCIFPEDGAFTKKAGFVKGLTAEEYYEKLPKAKQQATGNGSGKSGGTPDPAGCGGVLDSPDQAQANQDKAEWEVNVKAANEAAKQRGNVPASISRILGEIEESKVDWRAELRDFLTVKRPQRNCWSTPNRRFIGRGIYLPTMTGEALGHVAVAIDTSGSIGEKELQEFGGEITGILGNAPTKLTVIWCDCSIGRVDEYDDLSREELRLDPVGGGGTSHVPVFRYVDELADKPEVLVCLTDLMTEFPDNPGEVPTLWVSTSRDVQAPFGKTIELRN